MYADFLLDENDNATIIETSVVLEQLNNRSTSEQFAQNENPRCASISSNPLLVLQNPEQESHPQSGGNRGRLATGSTSTSNVDLHDSFKRMVDSIIHQPVTIDLTTDREQENDVIIGGQNDNIMPNVQLRGTCSTKSNKNDTHMQNQMSISKTQIDSSHKQQKKGRDVLASGPPSSNVANELKVSQRSGIVTPNNVNDVTTADDTDDIERVAENIAAVVPNGNDSQQFEPKASCDIETELNSHETTSALGDDGGYQQRDLAMATDDIPNMQHSQSIDLILGGEATEGQIVNGLTNGIQIVADQVQPSGKGKRK